MSEGHSLQNTRHRQADRDNYVIERCRRVVVGGGYGHVLRFTLLCIVNLPSGGCVNPSVSFKQPLKDINLNYIVNIHVCDTC